MSRVSRTTIAWITLSLAAIAAGCRMCASPFDYCGPTFTGQCCEECLSTARAGSILSGHMPPVPDDGYLGEGFYLEEGLYLDDGAHPEQGVYLDEGLDPDEAGPSDPAVRFSVRSVKSQRARLGLSAADYAALLGVSPSTIDDWESGQSQPNGQQLESLVAMRGLGRREAMARLELLRATQGDDDYLDEPILDEQAQHDEIDADIVLSSANEQLQEALKDEPRAEKRPIENQPQAEKDVKKLPSDGWTAVKRSKTRGR